MAAVERHELRFWAGASRVLLALFGLTLLPVLYPGMAPYRPLFGVYGAVALVEQLLIWRRIGGTPRAIVGGLVDAAVLTFVVYMVGSSATFMVSIYIYASMLNALVVSQGVGLLLAAAASAAYSTVLGLEAMGVLPPAPAAPPWVAVEAIGTVEAAISAALISATLMVSAAVVGKLVEALESREAALRAANARLESLSIRDPLTHLYNRRHLTEEVERELSQATHESAFALLMFDLDGFKQINDTLGHQRGDELLIAVARALEEAVRPGDLVCRYGGDEFVVVLWRTDFDEALPRAQQLAEAIRAIGRAFAPDAAVTASIGVAIADRGRPLEALLEAADEHAYEAKRRGGDRVVGAGIEVR